jgi:formimidoylglutamate deiminase
MGSSRTLLSKRIDTPLFDAKGSTLPMRYLAPAYIYTPQGMQANMLVSLTDDGYIDTITNRTTSLTLPHRIIESLPGTLLLPGFVNTHSHVFQRALRGHTHRPLASQDSFWSWRSTMYTEAQSLNPEKLYAIALYTYREMLTAGYTSVGEFHYVHHQPGGQPYANPNAMAEAVLQAGHDAGIRVVMLMAAYAQGGINQPLAE